MSLPLMGEYIAFQINPAATLEYFDDEEAMHACHRLVSRKYVACVYEWGGDVPTIPCVGSYLPLDLMPVSRGLVPSPDPSMIPEMSLPIGPSSHAHPLRRQPLQCDPPFPWSDFFHPTLLRIQARVMYHTEDTRARGKYQVKPRTQLDDVVETAEDDLDWSNDILEKLKKADILDATAGEFPLIIPADLKDHDWSGEMPVIDFTVDIEALKPDEIANPWLLFEECQALQRIQIGALRRIKQKIRDTQRLDDAMFAALRGVPPPPLLYDEPLTPVTEEQEPFIFSDLPRTNEVLAILDLGHHTISVPSESGAMTRAELRQKEADDEVRKEWQGQNGEGEHQSIFDFTEQKDEVRVLMKDIDSSDLCQHVYEYRSPISLQTAMHG